MKKKLATKLEFLKSTRFWKIVIAITLESLISYGVIDTVMAEMLAHAVSVILGISVTIRTVDRFSETLKK